METQGGEVERVSQVKRGQDLSYQRRVQFGEKSEIGVCYFEQLHLRESKKGFCLREQISGRKLGLLLDN
jgi:hypothetical protein